VATPALLLARQTTAARRLGGAVGGRPEAADGSAEREVEDEDRAAHDAGAGLRRVVDPAGGVVLGGAAGNGVLGADLATESAAAAASWA